MKREYRGLEIMNMTTFFTREMLLYSFFDIKLNKPFRLIWILYFIALIVIYSFPMFLLLKHNIAWWTLMIIIAPAVVGASVMSKPIWSGKSFMSFAKTQISYFFGPKIYYDLESKGDLKTRELDFEIMVSRKKDYAKLYNLSKGDKSWVKSKLG